MQETLCTVHCTVLYCSVQLQYYIDDYLSVVMKGDKPTQI